MNSILSARNLARMMVMVAMVFPFATHAGCHTNHTQVIRFHLPEIMLSGSEQVGTILAQDSIELSDKMKSSALACDNGGNLWALATRHMQTGSHTFSTNVPGIGYRLFINDQPFPFKMAIHCNAQTCQPQGAEASHIELQLVQTAPHILSSGQISGGTYGILRPDTGKPAFLVNLLNAVSVKRAACNPTSSTVDLGVASITDFPSRFSTSRRVSFAVKTNCPVAMPVKARWEGSTDRYGLLRTFPGKSEAGGISIRIRNASGSPVTFMQAFKDVPGAEQEKFSAEMVRTGDVKPGKVDAIATLHLFYE